jgi:hypothetical protein
MRDIGIDLLIEGHDPCDRPHRNLGGGQETPHPELARIGMAFLEVIDLDHPGQPALAGWGFRRTALVEQARKVLRRQPLDPGIDGGPGDR